MHQMTYAIPLSILLIFVSDCLRRTSGCNKWNLFFIANFLHFPNSCNEKVVKVRKNEFAKERGRELWEKKKVKKEIAYKIKCFFVFEKTKDEDDRGIFTLLLVDVTRCLYHSFLHTNSLTFSCFLALFVLFQLLRTLIILLHCLVIKCTRCVAYPHIHTHSRVQLKCNEKGLRK